LTNISFFQVTSMPSQLRDYCWQQMM